MRRMTLHADAGELCVLLFENLPDGTPPRVLCERIQRVGLTLLERISLATTGIARAASLRDADADLQALRGLLDLALVLEVLPEDTAFELAELADRIGRQLGGWLRRQPGHTMSTAAADP